MEELVLYFKLCLLYIHELCWNFYNWGLAQVVAAVCESVVNPMILSSTPTDQ